MTMEPIREWLDKLPDPIPLQASDDEGSDDRVAELLTQFPTLEKTTIAALLWLRIGRIDPAHAIVQDASRGIDAYVHGVIHRVEGDHWNSNYWFRQVRDEGLLSQIRSAMVANLRTSQIARDFRPSEFTNQCEQLLGKSTYRQAFVDLQVTAQAEWQSLWKIANQSAT